jgi:hypothetical protein
MAAIRLGDLLLKAGVVTEAQLDQALAEQKQWGGRIGTTLVRMGALSEDLLVKALSRQLGIARAQLGPGDPIVVPTAILAKVDRQLCERALLLPVQYIQERRTLQVAIADPFNVVALDDLSKRVGLRIEPLLAGETTLMQAIARLFGGVDGVDGSVRGTEAGLMFVDNGGNARDTRVPSPATPPPTSLPPSSSTPSPLAPPQMSPQLAAQLAAQTAAGLAQATSALPANDDLRVMAEQQQRAARALVELLAERGLFTATDFQAWQQRPR